MRTVEVFRNLKLAGHIIEKDGRYIFRYTNEYFADPTMPAVSLTLPKTQLEYKSDHLFPFFFNMLSEGANRKLQSRALRIDEKDHFGLLSATAYCDTVGAVTIKAVIT